MLALLKQSSRHALRVGLVVNAHGIALAVVRRHTGQRPRIEHCAMHGTEEGESIEQLLRRTLSKLDVAHVPIHAVVNVQDYQLVQVEAPEVPPAELRAAIRWRLRDLINFHIDDAVIDVFPIPDQSRRNPTKMLFAVAARSAAVQHLVSTIAPHARHFDVIDIPELCLRNLSAVLPQDQKGMATLLLGTDSALLNLTRQGVLYLARRIDYKRGFDLEHLGEQHIDAGLLALELQRSLDYFESHYDQLPITDLVVGPTGALADGLIARLRAEINLRLEVLELNTVFDGAEQMPTEPSADCLLALGAALRIESLSL